MPNPTRLKIVVALLLQAGVVAALSACGGATDSTADASTASAADLSSGTGLLSAVRAARKTAASDPLCDPAKLGDFYWEIGDGISARPLVSNSEGSASVTADSRFGIASASKFVFGAYVLQKKGIEQVRNDPALQDGLRFMSGYNSLKRELCYGQTTIGGCFRAGDNSRFTPETEHRFYYNGGHDQKLATVDLGMADFTSRQFDHEIQSTLGLSDSMQMKTFVPLPEGGLAASATDYAEFLRKVMTRQLVLGSHLGENAVCTLPSLCPQQAVYSPLMLLNEPWSYSYNHWVESEHGNGTVDAYSSPGAFGFYPWVTPDRKFYGIVSRHDTDNGAATASVQCGRQIRKAFLGALRQGA